MRYIYRKQRLISITEIRLLYQHACRQARRQLRDDDDQYWQLWHREIWPAYHIMLECHDAILEKSVYTKSARAILAVHDHPYRRFELLMHNPDIAKAYNWRYQRYDKHFKYLKTVAHLVKLGEPVANF